MDLKKVNNYFGYALFIVGALKAIMFILIIINVIMIFFGSGKSYDYEIFSNISTVIRFCTTYISCRFSCNDNIMF